MIDYISLIEVNGGIGNYTGKNATGAGTQDGTPFVAAFIDDIWGPKQALMDRASLTPNGVTESVAASQILEAMEKGYNLGAGYTIMYNKSGTPAANGDRVILLTGQGVLISNYPELDAACYVGDGNNAAVAAAGGGFYRADDAAGVTPNIAGIYLILPDYRGRVPRGDDVGATVDPQGAARVLGDAQADAMQKVTGSFEGERFTSSAPGVAAGAIANRTTSSRQRPEGIGANDTNQGFNFDNSASTSPNTAKTDDVETRMANVQTKFGITY